MSGLVVQWTGFLNPNKTGDYLLGIRGSGAARVFADDARVAQYGFGGGANLGVIHLEQGHRVKLRVNFARDGDGAIEAQLIWAPVSNAPDPAAIAAAKKADVVVAVVGITSRLEGEEMTRGAARLSGWGPHQPRLAQAGRGSGSGGRGHRQAARSWCS